MIAPRSHSTLTKCNKSMVHGIVKAPKSSFFCARDHFSNSTKMLHSVIIFKYYQSLLCSHIFHGLSITKHFFKSFYQRYIDGKLFQHTNEMSVLTIPSLLHQSQREWWWWSRNGDHFMEYLCFHRLMYQLTISFHYLIIFSHLIFYYRQHRWINGFLTPSSSDRHAMSIIFLF